MINSTSFVTKMPHIEYQEDIIKNKFMLEIFNNFLDYLSLLSTNYFYSYYNSFNEFEIAMYSNSIIPVLQEVKKNDISSSKNYNINIILSNNNSVINIKNDMVLGQTTFSFCPQNGAIYLKSYYGNSCKYLCNADTDINSTNLMQNISRTYYTEFAFFPNGIVYNVLKNGKHIPCTLKNIANTFSYNYLSYLFFSTYLNSFEYPLFKDVVNNINNGLKIYDGNLKLALKTVKTNYTVQEIIRCYSIQDIIQKHYKTCINVPKSVNKMFISEATNRALACRNVNENEKQKIYQVPYSQCEEKPNDVVRNFYLSRVKNSETCVEIIDDYIYMCEFIKEHFNLNISSSKKMLVNHDNVLIKYLSKKCKYNRKKLIYKNIKGKENPFYSLVLPTDFEIINSDIRLRKETEMMHNCVIIYRDKILKGKSLIAHLCHNGENCTIEIICKKSKQKQVFKCRQIFKECNYEVSDETKDYVNDVLKHINNKAVTPLMK